jgi:glycosyltransferase involved in cell wall biosynthesis
MHVSIIIATRNRAHLLRECLRRLAPQISRHDEIIVSDNGSSDSTAQIVQSLSHKYPITYVYEPRIGASFARNSGFRLVTNEITAFLDDDCMVTESYIKNIKKIVSGNTKQDEKIIFQGKIIHMYPQNTLAGYVKTLMSPTESEFRSLSSVPRDYATFKYVGAANMFCYTHFLSAVDGPFNAKVFPFIAEEADLVCRLILKGGRIRFVPQVTVIHKPTLNQTLVNYLNRRYLYGKAAYFLQKLYFSNPEFIFAYYSQKTTDRFSYCHSALESNNKTRFFKWCAKIVSKYNYIFYYAGFILTKLFLNLGIYRLPDERTS